MILKSSWSEVKRIAADKAVPLQWVDAGGFTYVMVVDGAFNVHAALQEGTPDYVDFITNHKTTVLRRISNANTALSNPEDYRFRGQSTGFIECAPGQVTNIDMVPSATEFRHVDGGSIIHKDSNPGDWVSFQVVHPLAGVVETYVPSWLIVPGTGDQQIEVYPAKIPPGLILRVAYTNVGATPAFCGINYRLHRKGTGT